MIPFKGVRMCPLCERQVLIGAYLMLPGNDKVEHYCIACALQLVKEYNAEHGIKTNKVLIVKPEDGEQA